MNILYIWIIQWILILFLNSYMQTVIGKAKQDETYLHFASSLFANGHY